MLRSFRSTLPILGLSLAAGVVSADNRIDGQRPDAPALAAYGDFAIGTRPIELVHQDQLEVVALDADDDAPDPLPAYDRALTVQMWYPAFSGAEGSRELRTFLRDGKTEVSLFGQGIQWAAPLADGHAFPLVIVSHGYPGNRFLLSHLAENLASKGYVVAAIDHLYSTYRTQAAFGSTLYHRPLDQLFVLESLAALNDDPTFFLAGMIDTSRTAIVGYSMGGYGAVIAAGGGLTQAAVEAPFAPPFELLDIHLDNSPTHDALPDPRVRTIIGFAPWGRQLGFFDRESLDEIDIPALYIAGSEDDVSGYATGVRQLWQDSTGSERALLTFDNANHNAGAPIPPPAESDAFDPSLGFAPFEHYADAVWDNVRMNNVSQHFVTAWLDRHLKDDPAADTFLDLIPVANEGVYAVDENGDFTDAHTYWTGFPDRTAKGLRFEVLEAGE